MYDKNEDNIWKIPDGNYIKVIDPTEREILLIERLGAERIPSPTIYHFPKESE